MLANFVFLAIAEVVLAFGSSLWYKLRFIPSLRALVLVLFLGTFGYVAAGTVFGAVAANTRMREVMLPVLQFTVAVAVFIGSIKATTGVLRGELFSIYADWVKPLVIFCVVSSFFPTCCSSMHSRNDVPGLLSETPTSNGPRPTDGRPST